MASGIDSQFLELFSSSFDQWIAMQFKDQQSRLLQAMHYCLSGPGKRVRALLAMEICAGYGIDPRRGLPAATAVEMIHAYSLAHDDLPCMDDDHFRRGRPSLHRAFDEATALLAGDALLTDSFRVLSDVEFFQPLANLALEERLQSLQELAVAAGSRGMVYGQDLDMYWTGRPDSTVETLHQIHLNKTGALIGAACAMGAIAGRQKPDAVLAWREFGRLIGLAFQAIDDTLDDSQASGKTPGKDEVQKKLTYLSFYSREQVLRLASDTTEKAICLIPNDFPKSDRIVTLAEQLIFRSV